MENIIWSRLNELINILREHSGRYDKEYYLKQYPDLKPILIATYHPYKKYYITGESLFKNIIDYSIDSNYIYTSIFELLDDLNSRKISGNEARVHIELYIEKYNTYTDIITRVFDRDLGCGISTKTINKVFKGLIPSFDTPLAKDYDPNKHDILSEKHYASRKLDGVRSLCFIDSPSNINFSSREGKPFYTLGKIKEDLELHWNLIGSFVIDGEICLIDETGQESFQGLMKYILRKDFTIPNPMFKVFDIYTQEEFINRDGKLLYSDTLNNYKNVFEFCKRINWLEQIPIYSIEDMEELIATMPSGWEGYILRRDAPTMFKRSKNLLKVKAFKDGEFIVEDIKIGKKFISGYEQNCISSLFIRYKGELVKVGSGLSDQQRIDWFNATQDIIGKTITVKYWSETIDQYGKPSLRFPTLKNIIS